MKIKSIFIKIILVLKTSKISKFEKDRILFGLLFLATVDIICKILK